MIDNKILVHDFQRCREKIPAIHQNIKIGDDVEKYIFTCMKDFLYRFQTNAYLRNMQALPQALACLS